MPTCSLPATVRARYHHLVLADPEFDRPGTVDMLIGGLYRMVLQPKTNILHTPGLRNAYTPWVDNCWFTTGLHSLISYIINY